MTEQKYPEVRFLAEGFFNKIFKSANQNDSEIVHLKEITYDYLDNKAESEKEAYLALLSAVVIISKKIKKGDNLTGILKDAETIINEQFLQIQDVVKN